MDYYVMPSGRTATFRLWNSQGKRLARVDATIGGSEPLTSPAGGERSSDPNSDYPHYEPITAEGITEVIEHKRMEPVFYVNDDIEIRKRLGIKP
jgi:hypothetical protein